MADDNKNQEEELNQSQKKGIFKAIQQWFDKLGFGDDEISSVDDPNVLDSTSNSSADPFIDRGIRTISTYNHSWRQKDDIEEEEERSGYLARDNRYRDYKQMIQEPELDSGVAVYADESTQVDEDGHVVQIESENSKIKDMLERLFYQKLNIDRAAWDIIYEMVWMGDSFREIYLDKETQKEILKLQRIKPEDVERKEKNNKLERFIVKGVDVEPFRVVHWRNKSIRFGNYGASIFESGRTVWKQLKLLEESVLVYRVTRAPERKIFYVDVGQTPPDKADGIVERFKQRFQKKKMIDINSGRIDTVANVMSYNESYYIPRVMGRQNSELTTLQSGTPSAGELDDLAYFKEKLLALLRVPREYVHGGGDSQVNQGVTTGKYLSEQDIRFSRIVGRVQENFIDGLKKIAVVYLALNGISAQEAEQFEIKMTKSSAIEQLRRIEVESQVFNLIAAIKGLDMFPDVWIMTKIMKLDEDEVAEIVHLMKVQRAQLQPETLAGGMGGGGGVFPGEMPPEGGEGGGGGGAIPPEVDQALQGAPGAAPQPGANQQMAAMLNDLEQEAKRYEEEENAAKTPRDRNAVKRSILKKRIKNKISAMREQFEAGNTDFDLLEELQEIEKDFKEIKTNGNKRLKEIAKDVRAVLEERKNKSKIKLEEIPNDYIKLSESKKNTEHGINSKKCYKVLMNENVIYDIKERGSNKQSVLDIVEAYFGSLDKRKRIEYKSPINNYLRELLMDGELKSLHKENGINIVHILKESMNKRKNSNDFNSDEVHMHGLLLEEIKEQFEDTKNQKKTSKKRKTRKNNETKN